ncbi:MAG: LysR family transcriptional regulator [Alphaproteobacteria bacterium]|nr:LysR family transcriptional regulator [Alphaproteobacteria bacterium]MCB9793670.1 LysR family transcriptional regulator [Alphaproteobacteria bacterium]
METDRIRACLGVVEHGSFAAAARAAHLSQPALWARVRGLEDELGVPLFTRVGRSVVPSAALHALLPQLRAVLGAIQALERASERVQQGTHPPPRVGCALSHIPRFLAPLLASLGDTLPARPRIVPASTDSMTSLLRSGAIDFAVHPPLEADLARAPLYTIHLVVVGAPQATAAAEELVRGPIATLPTDSGVRQLLEGLARRQGHALDVVLETRETSALLAWARANRVPAIVPDEVLAAAERADALRLTLGGEPVATTMWLYWLGDEALTPACRALLAAYRERSEL